MLWHPNECRTSEYTKKSYNAISRTQTTRGCEMAQQIKCSTHIDAGAAHL